MNKQIAFSLIASIFLCIALGYCSDEDSTEPTANESSSTTTSSTTTTSITKCPQNIPQNISASDGQPQDKIVITWDSVTNAEKYNIYRSTNADDGYELIGMASDTTYTDTNVTKAVNYYYKVSAIKDGCSETSLSDYDIGIAGFSTEGMVLINGGTFNMGDEWGIGHENQLPVHSVTVSSFYMDETEVTTANFEKYIQTYNPDTTWYKLFSKDKECNINLDNQLYDDHPANCVTWNAADDYCTKMGKRLPTEAEWEYAAGNGSEHWQFSLDRTKYTYSLDKYCTDKLELNETCSVKSHSPSILGLHHMSGNVLEWCSDYYDAKYYEKCGEGVIDPENTTISEYKSVRGLFSNTIYYLVTVASRRLENALNVYFIYGFRCVQKVASE